MQSPTPGTLNPAPVTHYENFPVASWLCPAPLRAPIAAIYHFARTADDLADEGEVPAHQRIADLTAYRRELHACAQHALADPPSRWPDIFGALHLHLVHFNLPVKLLDDLLDAFLQDTSKTAQGLGYADDAELMDYCRRSANPVGRLLLHLYGISGELAMQRSDAICSALQLINFWQDLSVDLPRGRFYVPQHLCEKYGLAQAELQTAVDTRRQPPNATQMIIELTDAARRLMLSGAPLVHQIPGRAGWELRLVVQGGLRILDRIAAQRYSTLLARPVLRKRDYGVMLWRALWM